MPNPTITNYFLNNSSQAPGQMKRGTGTFGDNIIKITGTGFDSNSIISSITSPHATITGITTTSSNPALGVIMGTFHAESDAESSVTLTVTVTNPGGFSDSHTLQPTVPAKM